MEIKAFTPEQIADWHRYEKVRKSGMFNMFDSRARALTGMTRERYSFVMDNYSQLKDAATPST